jgi:hypothetical protein
MEVSGDYFLQLIATRWLVKLIITKQQSFTAKRKHYNTFLQKSTSPSVLMAYVDGHWSHSEFKIDSRRQKLILMQVDTS